MTNDFLQDSKGNKSSKRLWGSICLANGIGLKNAEWLCGFFGKVISADQIVAMQQASSSLITIGCVLLGLGIGENLNKIFKRK
jgi:hypothetical protein